MMGKCLAATALEKSPSITVIVAGSKPQHAFKAAESIQGLGKRLLTLKVDYEEGIDPNHWEKVLSSIGENRPRSIRVINTRGVASGADIDKSLVQPATSLARGLTGASDHLRGIYKDDMPQTTFVHCSSIVTEVEGYDEHDPYTRARKKADSELRNIVEHGASIAIDYVKHDLNSPEAQAVVASTNNSNHDWDFASIALGLGGFQPLIGDGEGVAIQPVCERQLCNAFLSDILFHKAYSVVPGVGSKGYSLNELYTFYTQLAGTQPHLIEIAYPVAQWIAKHAPLGHIAPYAVNLLKYRSENSGLHVGPFDHTELEELAGEPIHNLEGIVEERGKASIVNGVNTPIKKHLGRIAKRLISSPEARSDFMKDVVPHIAPMLQSAAGAATKRVKGAISLRVEEE
jgi:hypothetical protein